MKYLIGKIVVLGLIFSTISCDKDDISSTRYEVSGVAQKGPFIIGTNITISELSADLSPTGINYYSIITDKNGSFQIPEVEFSSSFVKLIADGNYYHEIKDYNEPFRLTLTSIANLNDSSSININILTHLETERLEYLVNNEDFLFKHAKIKAQEEILSIFNIETINNSNSEYLNVLENDDNNAKLLAISSILQGNRTISELTEILTKIKIDIKEDGILNDDDIKTDLRDYTEFLRINNIERNLKNQFKLDTLSDFQKYISQFLEATDSDPNVSFDIPKQTEHGINLLALADNSILKADSLYCIAADIVCEDFSSLTVSIEKEDSIDCNYVDPSNQLINGWYLSLNSAQIECGLITQDSLSIIPFQFSGKGKLTFTININAHPTGWSYAVKEFILE